MNSQSVVDFEGVKELRQNFFFSFLSVSYVRVVLGIVNPFQIININKSVSISIKLLEGSHGNVSSKLVHLTSNISQKFIIVYLSVLISIEIGKELENLFFGLVESKVVQNVYEFVKIQISGIVFVSHSKEFSQRDYTSGSSGLKFLS